MRNRRLIRKAVISAFGILLLIYIAIQFHYNKLQKEQAPYIENNIVLSEMKVLSTIRGDDFYPELEKMLSSSDEYLNYGNYLKIKEMYPSGHLDFEDDYRRKKWKLSLKHWNEYFEELVAETNNERISVENIIFVGDGTFVSTDDNIPLEDGKVLTNQGEFINETGENLTEYFSNMKIFRFEDKIIAVMDQNQEDIHLKNCFLVDDSKEKTKLMKGPYFLLISKLMETSLLNGKRDEIVDLSFQNGLLTDVTVKEEYINGKILRINSEEIEIEGHGIFPLDDDMEIYRLFKELKAMGRKELALGYDFTDFVMEDGKVAACLMMREEYMEHIRVLLRTDHLEKKHHEKVVLSCDEDMEMISYLNGVVTEKTMIPAGEKLEFTVDDFSEGLSEDEKKRVKFVPSVLSARIFLHNIKRSQGIPSYKGCMEMTKLDDGLILVNELLLEDYLKYVVPSEMPAYYPVEALKAQAVCARTYAYGRMVRTGLPQYGAHVDDSAAFQVYNNIQSKAETTEAVNASYHEILTFEDSPIGAYYYSTSAGCGSEISIWHGNQENPVYLQAKEIGPSASLELAYELEDEEKFREFISKVDPDHFESEEGWYRWKIEKKVDLDALMEILQTRYELYPEKILVQNDEGEFESQNIPSIGKLKNIEITKRMAGGIADELLITGENVVIKVISELNIRHILSAGKSEVERQSGDTVSQSMLPSAFVSLDLTEDDGYITEYTITGGGFGHGIGMSQNGAKNMAKQGMNYKTILDFYYTDAKISTLSGNES